MLDTPSAEEQLQSLKLPLIQTYAEPAGDDDPSFLVIVAEGLVGELLAPEIVAVETNAVLREMKASARPIIISKESRLFELAWDRIFSFMVMDEVYGHLDHGESVGDVFARMSSSPFLEYCKSNLFLFEERSLFHSRIRCVDRFIDVLSEGEPKITRLR